MDGIGPDMIRVKELIQRLGNQEVREVISNEVKSTKEKKKMTLNDKNEMIKNIELEMKKAASELDFERAMELRDALFELRSGD